MDLELYSKLAEPLEGDKPAGVDASESAEFDLIDVETIQKQSINAKPTNWIIVEKNAVIILSQQSKDLRVACYLAVALHQLQGIAGLTVGLQLLVDIVKADYWADIFPYRKKRPNKLRASSFGMVNAHLERFFKTFELNENSDFAELLKVCNSYLLLDEALSERLEKDVPPNSAGLKSQFRKIQQQAKAYLAQVEKEQAQIEAKAEAEALAEEERNKPPSVMERAKNTIKSVKDAIAPAKENEKQSEPAQTPPQQEVKAPEPSAQTQPQPVVAQSAPVDVPIHTQLDTVTQDNIEKALNASRTTLLAVAKALRATNPLDVTAFYLTRVAQWVVVDEVPPNNVMPPNPTEQQMEDLEALATNQQFDALIQQGENLFEQGAIFSGALHRYIANALEAKGLNDAAFMVKSCLQQYVKRLPKLSQHQFNNGKTFIDQVTLAWLSESEKNIDKSAIGGSQTSATNDTNSATWIEASTQAMALLAKGQFDAGIAIFAQGLATATSLREQTYWQLEQAKFCARADHVDLALSQFAQLERFMVANQLSDWEPQLRVEIITELLQSHVNKMAKAQYTAEQKQALMPLYQELSLKDPVAALAIKIE